ncbi:MAG: hypothetical protein GY854_06365 [Deltaproteobacteria bacterium]|nr:hypothetical protein [Deltaproteobacteria bacterium]
MARIEDHFGAMVVHAREDHDGVDPEWTERYPLSSPKGIADLEKKWTTKEQRAGLISFANNASRGIIRCFGRWDEDYGVPIDWHRETKKGLGWSEEVIRTRLRGVGRRLGLGHWSNTVGDYDTAGDIKVIWEVARFPQAYFLARAAVLSPKEAERFAETFFKQVEDFIDANPLGYGVHWSSGQEVAFRILAWLFGAAVFQRLGFCERRYARSIAKAAGAAASHVERHINYARRAVYNNHLLSEALLLFVVGHLFPRYPTANRWVSRGRDLLEEGVECQFYKDGGYIQLSHNYHRVALQDLLLATIFSRRFDGDIPKKWISALERSVGFLAAHQNATNGRLPNFGSNDGSLPFILSTCDYSDFRPTLQAASLIATGERLYGEGPWDEEAAWLNGAAALDRPRRRITLESVSFKYTGFHVLRADEKTFATFRCGTVRDRFAQIDMLHVDYWRRGENILVDGGSFLYNGPRDWHDHFVRTKSHNTVTIDNADQMVHHRKFKFIRWTQAGNLTMRSGPRWTICTGEHYGYKSLPCEAVHRRSVLLLKDGSLVVVDRVFGEQEFDARLQWLVGSFATEHNEGDAVVRIGTKENDIVLAVMDENCRSRFGTLVRGRELPPRGWLSRYYGEKVSVPSLAVRERGVDVLFVTLCGIEGTTLRKQRGHYCLNTEGGDLYFELNGGEIVEVREGTK